MDRLSVCRCALPYRNIERVRSCKVMGSNNLPPDAGLRNSRERKLIILNADDYAISPGVSNGIEELASAHRISSASALVTLPNWGHYARKLADLRKYIAIGLHVNLTLGAPLSPMPDLAPSGTFPSIRNLLLRCLSNGINEHEITAEISRQISRFVDETGHLPDIIDGHQHVQVLPGIRAGFLRAIAANLPATSVLVRDPSDKTLSILSRRTATGKALGIKTLAFGFGAAVRRIGFITNRGFAGFSDFNTRRPLAEEFNRFSHHPGSRHMVMCHPGYPDDQLERLDAVVERRRNELDYLLATPVSERIWHIGSRDENGRGLWMTTCAAT